MAVTELQTLQNLYKAGMTPQTPVVMQWRPLDEDLEKQVQTLSMISNYTAPKIALPPFDQGFEGPPPQPKQSRRDLFMHKLDDLSSSGSSSGSDKWGPFGKVDRGGETIWLESRSEFPKKKKKNKNKGGQKAAYGQRRMGDFTEASYGLDERSADRRIGGKKKKKEKDNKGETIWLESSVKFPSSSSSSGSGGYSRNAPKKRSGLSSSSSGGYWGKPKKKGGCYCSIGRTEKGDDAALITLGSIGIPLAVVATLFGGSLGGGTINDVIGTIGDTINDILGNFLPNGGRRRRGPNAAAETPEATPAVNVQQARNAFALLSPLVWPTILKKVLTFNWKEYAEAGRSLHDSASILAWKFVTSGLSRAARSCGSEGRDLGNDMEFIDENEIVLRMLDDLMMTYKYGYVPKCTRSHICKLNKAAASGGQPQSTLVPLMSLPAAWLLGKPSSNVMDFLHAVWLGRNEKDCDEVFPECTDIYSSLRFKGGSADNSTDTDLEEDMHMDELLNDLRYLEENNQAPAEHDGEHVVDGAPDHKTT